MWASREKVLRCATRLLRAVCFLRTVPAFVPAAEKSDNTSAAARTHPVICRCVKFNTLDLQRALAPASRRRNGASRSRPEDTVRRPPCLGPAWQALRVNIENYTHDVIVKRNGTAATRRTYRSTHHTASSTPTSAALWKRVRKKQRRVAPAITPCDQEKNVLSGF